MDGKWVCMSASETARSNEWSTDKRNVKTTQILLKATAHTEQSPSAASIYRICILTVIIFFLFFLAALVVVAPCIHFNKSFVSLFSSLVGFSSILLFTALSHSFFFIKFSFFFLQRISSNILLLLLLFYFKLAYTFFSHCWFSLFSFRALSILYVKSQLFFSLFLSFCSLIAVVVAAGVCVLHLVLFYWTGHVED